MFITFIPVSLTKPKGTIVKFSGKNLSDYAQMGWPLKNIDTVRTRQQFSFHSGGYVSIHYSSLTRKYILTGKLLTADVDINKLKTVEWLSLTDKIELLKFMMYKGEIKIALKEAQIKVAEEEHEQTSLLPSITRRDKKYDDCARSIAELFNCTEAYVHKIMSPKTTHRYTGIKPNKIRQAYQKYKSEKERIFNELKQTLA